MKSYFFIFKTRREAQEMIRFDSQSGAVEG